MSIYEDLKKNADPFIEYYRDDLLVHDKNALEKHPGIPFLHFTGDTGTHLVFLWPSSVYIDEWRESFNRFGSSPFERRIAEIPSLVEMMPRYCRGKLALYFDGKNLKKVSYGESKYIAEKYARDLIRELNEKIKRNGGN